MEVSGERRADAAVWEAMRGLTLAEYGAITADLRARGLEGTPAYAAWLRAALTKAALRKRAALADSALADSAPRYVAPAA